jgi:hypothetical protein
MPLLINNVLSLMLFTVNVPVLLKVQMVLLPDVVCEPPQVAVRVPVTYEMTMTPEPPLLPARLPVV